MNTNGITVVNDVRDNNIYETRLLQTVAIEGNTVDNHGDSFVLVPAAIGVDNVAAGYLSTLVQTLDIVGNSVGEIATGDEVYKYRFGARDTEVRRLVIAKPGVSLDSVC